VDDPDLFAIFVHPLHRAGIRYMVTGSLASMHYGEPRFTLDAVLVVHLDEAEIASLTSAFPEADYYTPPREIIVQELRRSSNAHFKRPAHAHGVEGRFLSVAPTSLLVVGLGASAL
jgi:hypothetical protein